jgi:hypothetical protein
MKCERSDFLTFHNTHSSQPNVFPDKNRDTTRTTISTRHPRSSPRDLYLSIDTFLISFLITRSIAEECRDSACRSLPSCLLTAVVGIARPLLIDQPQVPESDLSTYTLYEVDGRQPPVTELSDAQTLSLTESAFAPCRITTTR